MTTPVHAGQASVVDAREPRYRAQFTAYLPNPDQSSTCIMISCTHLHVDFDAARACGDRLRWRVEHKPWSVPEVAEELRRRGEVER